MKTKKPFFSVCVGGFVFCLLLIGIVPACGRVAKAPDIQEKLLRVELLLPEGIEKDGRRTLNFWKVANHLRVQLTEKGKSLCEAEYEMPPMTSTVLRGCAISNAESVLVSAVLLHRETRRRVADGQVRFRSSEAGGGDSIALKLKLRVPVAQFD